MATKDELVAFGQANGVAVDMSMLKSDIEAAIADAGYDPTTIGEDPPVSEEPTNGGGEVPAEVERTSSDAKFSTYAEVTPETDVTPEPGPQVEQTRGTASE